MKPVAKKITGAFRAGAITALVLLFSSFLFSGISMIVTVLLLKIGTAAIYVGLLVNIFGAGFSAWAGARLAMLGREMKMKRSTSAAFIGSFIPSLLNLMLVITGSVFSATSGREIFYIPKIVEAVSFFAVAFFVSKTVFKKRETKVDMRAFLPQEDSLDSF